MNARVGERRRRVTLQRNTPTSNSVNQQKPSWADVATYWAKIRPISGTEAINADRLKSKATSVIEMRYVGDINPTTNRFRFGDRIFNIESVIDVDERKTEMEIHVIEVKNPA